jgi:hypothetical protein
VGALPCTNTPTLFAPASAASRISAQTVSAGGSSLTSVRELVVDHLVGVAEQQQPVPGGGQGLEQLPLPGVGVLELVADSQRPAALKEAADHRHADDAESSGQQVAVGEDGRVCCEQLAFGFAAQPDVRPVAGVAAEVGNELPGEAVEGEDVHPAGHVLQEAAAAVQDLGDRGPAERQEQNPVPAPARRVPAGQVGAGGCGGGDGLAGAGASEHKESGRLTVAD